MTKSFPENFSTLAVHGGVHIDPATGAAKTPIYQTSAYHLPKNNADVSDLFAFRSLEHYTYTRSGNPTNAALEEKIALLDGGSAAVATASGQSAMFVALEPLISQGKRIIMSAHAFGGSHSLLAGKLPKMGVQIDWFDPTDPESIRDLYTDQTVAIVAETLSNPDNIIADLEGISNVARDYKLPVIVDNTLATPYLWQPLKDGAHVVVYSATKFLNGHGNSVAGLVVDGGTFNWKDDARYPALSALRPTADGSRAPDPSLANAYNEIAYSVAVRQSLTVFGPTLSPQNAALTMTGIETLPLRMKQHVTNAQAVAEFLHNHDEVAWVKYAGLPHDANYARAQKYMPRGAGSVMAVKFKGGADASETFIQNTKLISHMANIGETKTIVIATDISTHRQLTAAQKELTGTGPGVLRFSIGIEDTADIIQDIAQALAPQKTGLRHDYP